MLKHKNKREKIDKKFENFAMLKNLYVKKISKYGNNLDPDPDPCVSSADIGFGSGSASKLNGS